jgi:hypothetical protein
LDSTTLVVNQDRASVGVKIKIFVELSTYPKIAISCKTVAHAN